MRRACACACACLSECACACVCVPAHVCVLCTCMCVHASVCLCTCACVCLCICMPVCVRVRVCMCMYVCVNWPIRVRHQPSGPVPLLLPAVLVALLPVCVFLTHPTLQPEIGGPTAFLGLGFFHSQAVTRVCQVEQGFSWDPRSRKVRTEERRQGCAQDTPLSALGSVPGLAPCPPLCLGSAPHP